MTKNSFDRYMKLLETDVGPRYISLGRWCINVGLSYANEKLTKAEFRKLLREGRKYQVDL